MTEIYTSNFARIRRIREAGVIPVGIAIGPPRWYRGHSLKHLAPSREMLSSPRPDYDLNFSRLLEDIDPQDILSELQGIGDRVALLCWESPNIWCHRRMVAEWLELKFEIVIPEYGFEREFSLPYSAMPPKKQRPKPAGKKKPPSQAKLW